MQPNDDQKTDDEPTKPNGEEERQSRAPAIYESAAPISASGRFMPRNYSELMEYVKYIAGSDLVPKEYRGKPATILLAIQFGVEVGLPMTQALHGVAMIGGRPSVWGDHALGIVRRSGLMEKLREYATGSIADGDYIAYCEVKRKGEDPILNEYSIDDAKTAKLWEKKGRDGQDTPWITNPKRQLKMRARGFSLRDGFADVLKGLYLTEELIGEVDEPPARVVPGSTVVEATLVGEPHPVDDELHDIRTKLHWTPAMLQAQLTRFGDKDHLLAHMRAELAKHERTGRSRAERENAPPTEKPPANGDSDAPGSITAGTQRRLFKLLNAHRSPRYPEGVRLDADRYELFEIVSQRPRADLHDTHKGAPSFKMLSEKRAAAMIDWLEKYERGEQSLPEEGQTIAVVQKLRCIACAATRGETHGANCPVDETDEPLGNSEREDPTLL